MNRRVQASLETNWAFKNVFQFLHPGRERLVFRKVCSFCCSSEPLCVKWVKARTESLKMLKNVSRKTPTFRVEKAPSEISEFHVELRVHCEIETLRKYQTYQVKKIFTRGLTLQWAYLFSIFQEEVLESIHGLSLGAKLVRDDPLVRRLFQRIG